MKKVGVIFSGCGFLDGAEIQESVLTLLALSKHEVEVVSMAPNINQHHVVDHLTGKETGETRNVLVESARIVRGNIKEIKEVDANSLDALILPGGYGVAKNLCDFAFKGPSSEVNPDVAALIKAVHEAGKPIGAICIAPALMAKVLEGNSVKLTIGTDQDTAGAIESLGQCHENRNVAQTCLDEDKKIITTPAYMLAQNVGEAYSGIEKLVNEVIGLVK